MKTYMGLSAGFNHIWQDPVVRKEYIAGTAITLFLFSSMLAVPVVGLFVGILTPLPSLLFLYRWGVVVGMWVPGTAALLGALLFPVMGLTAGLPLLMGFLLLGILVSVGMGLGWSLEKTVIVPVVVLFVLGALFVAITFRGVEEGVTARVERNIQTAVSLLLQELAPESPERSELEYSLRAVVPVLVRSIPGIFLSTLMTVVWLNILTAKRYCRLKNVQWPQWPDWKQWRAPEPLVWGVIVSGVALLLPVLTLNHFAVNALLVLGAVYFFQGLSLTVFYVEKWNLPFVLKGLIFTFILLQQFVTLAVMLFGFFDVWFDFRKSTEKQEKI